MAWLIEQRRALEGQIDRKRRHIAQAQRALEDLPRALVDLEARLAHPQLALAPRHVGAVHVYDALQRRRVALP